MLHGTSLTYDFTPDEAYSGTQRFPRNTPYQVPYSMLSNEKGGAFLLCRCCALRLMPGIYRQGSFQAIRCIQAARWRTHVEAFLIRSTALSQSCVLS